MEVYTDLESIRERIEELQNEIADKTQTADAIRESNQDFCQTDYEDSSENCAPDCTDCAEALACDMESERDDLESEQEILQDFVSETEHIFGPLVDHLLSEYKGKLSAVTDWLGQNDYTVHDDWESYGRDFVENNYNEIPSFIANHIDYSTLGNDLSMDVSWEEIGGCVVIFY